jgi:hypothetical protein
MDYAAIFAGRVRLSDLPAHNHTSAATPGFGKAHTHDLQFR